MVVGNGTKATERNDKSDEIATAGRPGGLWRNRFLHPSVRDRLEAEERIRVWH
jgi:hypothetical protein